MLGKWFLYSKLLGTTPEFYERIGLEQPGLLSVVKGFIMDKTKDIIDSLKKIVDNSKWSQISQYAPWVGADASIADVFQNPSNISSWEPKKMSDLDALNKIRIAIGEPPLKYVPIVKWQTWKELTKEQLQWLFDQNFATELQN